MVLFATALAALLVPCLILDPTLTPSARAAAEPTREPMSESTSEPTSEPTFDHPFILPDDFPSLRMAAWRVERPAEPQVLMEPRYPWDVDVHSHGTVLVDPIDGLWKAWYVSTGGIAQGLHNNGNGRHITYAYSADGINWTRPLLSIQPYWNYTHTNIILTLGGDKPGPNQASCSYASVFVDPHATDLGKVYEMLVLCELPPPMFKNAPPGCGDDVPAGKPGRVICMYRLFAHDGIHWLPGEAVPPSNDISDGANVYKEPDGTYVTYVKTNLPSFPGGLMPMDIDAGTTRVMAKATSVNGSVWSDASIIATADWRDSGGDQLLEISPIYAAGGVHLGTITVMHAASATIDVHFAASRDGKNWWRPGRRSIVPQPAEGEYGGGLQWPFKQLVPDPKDPSTVHLYFSGTEGFHGDLFSTQAMENIRGADYFGEAAPWPECQQNDGLSPEGCGLVNYENMPSGMQQMNLFGTCIPFRGAMMRATWTKARLWGLIPAAGGDVAGVATSRIYRGVAGRSLVINAVSYRSGVLRAALLYVDSAYATNGTAVPGFGFNDCTPFRGDEQAATLAWKGGSRVPGSPKIKATGVRVSFQLLRSRLYSLRWQ